MFLVKDEDVMVQTAQELRAAKAIEAAQGWGWSAETTVDQTLIRRLAAAFRFFVSGLSAV
jgi:hypothetical protein